jgi:succinyl-diaminopimelate desuccinylase
MFKAIINEYRKDIISNVQDLVKIRSYEDEAAEGMPFGKDVNEALQFALKLSENIGMKTKNLDGYVGYADYGDGEETVGVLVHLDVVPEGNGWNYPPYDAVIDNGRIYGRGTNDDKGPVVSVLYAIKALKELNIDTNKKIRIIFGANEETDWKCIDRYKETEEVPDISFTPDGDFPVVFAEKGLYVFELHKKWDDTVSKGVVQSIRGGSAINCVPDYAEAVLAMKALEIERIINKINKYVDCGDNRFFYKKVDNGIKIISRGVSAHGSMPELGDNAICNLLEFLAHTVSDEDEINRIIKVMNKQIGLEYNGKSLGCDYRDEASGALTLNMGTIYFDGSELSIGVDLRYPVTHDKKIIQESLENLMVESSLELRILKEFDSIFLPKESKLISTLLESYQRVTDDYSSQPIAMGGATYARAFKNTVAFGGVFPNSEDRSHQSDEYISIDDLMMMTEIYTNALYELTR